MKRGLWIVLVVLWASPVWAATETITFKWNLPTRNTDGSRIFDFKETQVTFTVDGGGDWDPTAATRFGVPLTIVDNMVTVPGQATAAGYREELTVELTYPDGGSQLGQISIVAVDVNDVAGAAYVVPFTAALQSTIGAPGSSVGIGACSN